MSMLLEIQAAGRGRRNLQPIAEDFMDCVCFMKLSVLKPQKTHLSHPVSNSVIACFDYCINSST